MATSKTYYFCDICGKRHNEKEYALECEKSHKVPVEVSSPTYSHQDNKPTYPEDVLIKFSDGTTARYYRKSRW